jgi:glycerol transport system ATP-binding protein
VVQVGTPPELFECPAHTFVGRFIGAPGMNVIKANLQGSMAWIGSQSVSLEKSYRLDDGPVELGIRPEYVQVTAEEGIPAQVIGIEDMGRHVVLKTRVEGQAIDVILKEGVPIPAAPHLLFTAGKLNVYRDSYLLEPRDR